MKILAPVLLPCLLLAGCSGEPEKPAPKRTPASNAFTHQGAPDELAELVPPGTAGIVYFKDLDALLERAVAKGIFGTKMRSVIDAANKDGIAAVVHQQFDIGRQILQHGLVPIIEPEVTISIADKAEAEEILLAEIKQQLDALGADQQVMLKLTLPERQTSTSRWSTIRA